MTAPHSPTPSQLWTYDDSSARGDCIKDATGRVLMYCSDAPGINDTISYDVDLERIAAEHNACAGLANPSKLPELIAAVRRYTMDAAMGGSHLDIGPMVDALRALQATPAESEAPTK